MSPSSPADLTAGMVAVDRAAGELRRKRLSRERVQGFQDASRPRLIAARNRFGIVQKVSEAVGAVVVFIGNVVMANGTDDRHVVFGP